MIGSELVMELMKKTTEPYMPRKRPLDEANDSKNEESKSRKTAPKFPPGCGIKQNNQNIGSDKHEYDTVKHNIKHKKPDPNKSYLGSRPASKVKFFDPLACSEEGNAQKPTVTTTVVIRRGPFKKPDDVHTTFGKLTSYSDDKLKRTTPISLIEQVRREKINEAMIMFDDKYRQLCQMNSLKPREEKQRAWKISIDVAKIVKQKMRWMDAEKTFGAICGVQVGDKFRFRAQLHMIGLHCQQQSGIDYTNVDGRNLAISIVDSHRYPNESKSCDTLNYSGHGGLEFSGHNLPPEDQKLERGNLALKNSITAKNPVRVIRKVEGSWKNMVFVYDGLYVVKDYTLKKGAEGNMVFNFRLNRVHGQPPLYKMFNASR